MITISNALLAIIMVVSFWIGFGFCALVCINGVTQPEDEAKQDESHSATRYEKPTIEQIAAAREIIREDGHCDGIDCHDCPFEQECTSIERAAGASPLAPWADAARAWLAAHNLPIEEPKK